MRERTLNGTITTMSHTTQIDSLKTRIIDLKTTNEPPKKKRISSPTIQKSNNSPSNDKNKTSSLISVSPCSISGTS